MSRPAQSPRRFALYARYYDLLYGGKDYAGEARFVDGRLRAARAPGRDLLELGCGTGRHAAALSRLGWRIDGYDLSPSMVARARALKIGGRRPPQFRVGDMARVRAGRTYDAVVSLFHAVCYQTSDRRLDATLRTAAAHLRPGGLFLFDFWNGPAVLADRPSVRVRTVEDARIAVTRTARPSLDVARGVVTVNFDIAIVAKSSGRVHRIRERHRVRYLFLRDLEQRLAAHGLDVCAHGRWMSRAALDARSWYGWLLARRRAGEATLL